MLSLGHSAFLHRGESRVAKTGKHPVKEDGEESVALFAIMTGFISGRDESKTTRPLALGTRALTEMKNVRSLLRAF
ncbi:MAG: hypothetical protein KDJ76_15135 [Xanthobacteraceae bacterium]|nr:hypothetical protein [Xanthobacteraceae bacterium]